MSNSNLTANTPNSSPINAAYAALDRAAHGSPEAMAAIADIQSYERAVAKANENVIHGTGMGGHESGGYTIHPKNATPGREYITPGSMVVGEASPDMTEGIVTIGGFQTSIVVAEAMRRGMSAGEWTAMTGLPYQSLTQTNHGAAQPSGHKARFEVDPKLQSVQDALDRNLSLEEMLAAEADTKRVAAEVDAISFDTSLLEQVMTDTLGHDITVSATKQLVDSGEIDMEALGKLGVDDSMISDAVQHYTAAAETMLAPVNSSVAYLQNFLSDAEAVKVRQAIVSRDMSVTQHYGEIAKNRAASMSHREVTDFLSKGERAQLRLRSQGGQAIIDLPNGVTTSWSAAIINGLISFSSK